MGRIDYGTERGLPGGKGQKTESGLHTERDVARGFVGLRRQSSNE